MCCNVCVRVCVFVCFCIFALRIARCALCVLGFGRFGVVLCCVVEGVVLAVCVCFILWVFVMVFVLLHCMIWVCIILYDVCGADIILCVVRCVLGVVWYVCVRVLVLVLCVLSRCDVVGSFIRCARSAIRCELLQHKCVPPPDLASIANQLYGPGIAHG